MDKIYYELTINEKEVVENLIKDTNNKFIKSEGVYINDNIFTCYRCGNISLVKFKRKLYCKNCIEFGIVDENTVFYTLTFTKRIFEYVDRLEEIKLTSKQYISSRFIYSNLINQTDCLVHAVCGAGKTEITFQTIAYILQKNQYVCFAIPRIDILYEVAERLKYYFYKTKICILNSQEEKIQHGQIYVMTTNQIIKFKNAFNLIIIDEIDAFPFEYNPKYDYGAQSAKKKDGIIVYLTSTPSEMVLKKKLNTYIINRRWHGYLLPEPIYRYFDLENFLLKGNKEFIELVKQYETREDKRQLLLFISNIKQGHIILNILRGANIEVNFVYSSSLRRREDVQNFKNKKNKILLTTTILERGVTFEDIDVIVLDASNQLYTIAALIQIAGRVGRKIKYQDGKVYFYYTNITRNMKKASESIEKLNNN